MAGQLSGQSDYPHLPLTPAECCSLLEWKAVHVCVIYESHSKSNLKIDIATSLAQFGVAVILMFF